MSDGSGFNSAWLAEHLGVTRSAVSNWIARKVLPENLRPFYLGGNPYWDFSQLAGIEEWHANRPRRDKRAPVPDGDLGKLLAYTQAAKKAAAVRGHQGISAEDDAYWMGAAYAYQDMANLISRKTGQ